MPYRISQDSRTIDIYAAQTDRFKIYSWTEKTYDTKEVFPVLALYYVQVRFSSEERLENYKEALKQLFSGVNP